LNLTKRGESVYDPVGAASVPLRKSLPGEADSVAGNALDGVVFHVDEAAKIVGVETVAAAAVGS
jgi:hypothetical protein